LAATCPTGVRRSSLTIHRSAVAIATDPQGGGTPSGHHRRERRARDVSTPILYRFRTARFQLTGKSGSVDGLCPEVDPEPDPAFFPAACTELRLERLFQADLICPRLGGQVWQRGRLVHDDA
jgi:hypothetical protein